MKATFLLAGLAMAAAAPAEATIISANFGGRVTNQVGSTSAVGSTVSGAFVYDTAAATFLTFTIGSYGLPTGAFSSFAPGPFTRTFDAQFKATQTIGGQGAPSNTSLTVDLSSDTGFNTSNLAAFAANPGPFVTDPNDPNGVSTISYAALTRTGAVATRIDANLTTFAATVPEPASLSLLAIGMAGAVLRRRWAK